MFPSNPFLIRELRQHAKQRKTLQLWTAGFAGLMCLPIFLALFLHGFMRDRWPVWGTTGIQLVHVVLCLGVGLYSGYRVYEAESTQHTLESVLLLPYRPIPWLLQKLAPSLAIGLTFLLLGLPIYVSASVLGMERMASLPKLLGQALLAMAGGMSLLLLFPPVRDAPPKVAGQPTAVQGRAVWRESSKVLLLFFLPGVVVLLTAGRVLGPSTWVRLYGAPAPLMPLLFIIGVVGLIAILLTAATPIGPEAWERRAARFRIVSCVFLFYLGAGALWQRLPLPAALLLLVVPPAAVALSDRFNPQRKKNPRSEQELRRVASWSQNPVLLLDYRIQSRSDSLLRSFGHGVLIGLIIVLVCRWISGSWTATLRTLLTGGGFSIWMVVFTSLGGAAAAMWQKEAAANALSSLFLTPLTSREIVKGRLAAASLRSLGSPLGMILPVALVPVLVAPGITWKVAASLLGMLPVLASTNLCSGFSFNDKGMPRPPLTDAEHGGYWGVWLIHAVGLACCTYALVQGLGGKPWAWVPAAVAFLIQCAAARWMFELKVRRLQAIREADFVGTGKD